MAVHQSGRIHRAWLLAIAHSLLCLDALPTDAAKQQRRRPPPDYRDRVYDSVSRALPTLLERRLFGRLLAARVPLSVREAARLVVWFR